jgi:hypothetical protein
MSYLYFPVEGCHEPVGGVGYIQQIWLHDLPWSECGRTMLVKMQQQELYQWGLMVGTRSTLEKGHVQ